MPTFVVVRTPTPAVSLGDGSSAHSTAELAVVLLLLLLLLLVSWGRRRWREWWRRLGSGQSPHRRAVARGKPRPAQLAVPCVRLPPPLPLQPPVSHTTDGCPALFSAPPRVLCHGAGASVHAGRGRRASYGWRRRGAGMAISRCRCQPYTRWLPAATICARAWMMGAIDTCLRRSEGLRHRSALKGCGRAGPPSWLCVMVPAGFRGSCGARCVSR
eukprot:COSAG01_NODE_1255_length_11040_cov_67.549584_5_plen_215_part_00